jgi:hypothetical protein
MSRAKNIAVEVIQFAPILTLASTFVVSGEVDLERAGTLFVVAAAEALVITGVLAAFRLALNPILLGTNLWLVIGALAFGLSIEPLAALVSRTRAVGLFGCALIVGGLLTAFAPRGYVGVELRDRGTVRRGSLIMLALTAVALVWSWSFVADIRLGGGLPFIALNVSRRVLARRLR